MAIEKVVIENFKCFNTRFAIEFNSNLNIIVGDNESGKSTIFEAIHLALTGMIGGKYLKNDLTQYLFNKSVCDTFIKATEKGQAVNLPQILIEVYFKSEDFPNFIGDDNSNKEKACGVYLKIAFDEKYQEEYIELLKKGYIKTLPIEYYDVVWKSFAREYVTYRSIPIKSALIDSASNRYQNGSDVYISRIIKDHLDISEIVDVTQAYRRIRESFMADDSIKAINDKIKTASRISNKEVMLSVDLSSSNAWEGSLTTLLDEIPFHHIGKGEQCIIKTKLSLGNKKAKNAKLILLEEPENHLSHSKLNQLIKEIQENCSDKQVIISTHSSFVANKLGLENLIILENKLITRLKDLYYDTKEFFQKLSGYDTLRLILCKRAILVEGDSDELVVQKAYMVHHDNKLPLEDCVDVISVGTSFLRFLEIAKRISKKISIIIDNDGNVEALKRKYAEYLGDNCQENIKICFDDKVDSGDLKIGDKKYNYNTLEPKLLKVNSLSKFNKIFSKKFKSADELLIHMHSNKTECALKIFNSQEDIIFPKYIMEAI